MKYTKDERVEIGRQIYEGEITRNKAAEEYGIGKYTARDYMRMYRDINHLPPKSKGGRRKSVGTFSHVRKLPEVEDLEAMTKEELIQVLIKSGITERQLKQLVK